MERRVTGCSRSPCGAVFTPWLNLELAATAVLGFLFFRDHLDVVGWLGSHGKRDV
jgi:hypothetical protein